MNTVVLTPNGRFRVTLTELLDSERPNNIDISSIKFFVTNRDVISSFEYKQEDPSTAELTTREDAEGVTSIVFSARTNDGRRVFAIQGVVVTNNADVYTIGVDEITTPQVENDAASVDQETPVAEAKESYDLSSVIPSDVPSFADGGRVSSPGSDSVEEIPI